MKITALLASSLLLSIFPLYATAAAAMAKDDQAAKAGDTAFRSLDIYIERNNPYFRNHGFFEHGMANREEQFGNLEHERSTYESRHDMADSTPFARGINAIQTIRAHDRFWIASIMWEERPGLTIPEKYVLPPAKVHGKVLKQAQS